jgi:uncharacterized protein with PIN domain
MVLVQRAFSERAKGEREQFELCPDCCENMAKIMREEIKDGV